MSRTGAPPRRPDEPAPRDPDPAPGPRFGGPRLPRVYVPRPALWEHLDRATRSAVTLLVAPGGAGKSLGIGGWLKHTHAPYAATATWIRADATWTPNRLDAVLEAAAGASPRLVVVDDAHALPAATVRLLDRWLTEAPDRVRVLLASRWDLPLTRLLSELLGHLVVLRGDLLRMTDGECATLVAEHARTTDPEVVRDPDRPRPRLVRGRRADRPGGRCRPRPGGRGPTTGRRPRHRRRPGGQRGADRPLPAPAPPAAERGR